MRKGVKKNPVPLLTYVVPPLMLQENEKSSPP